LGEFQHDAYANQGHFEKGRGRWEGGQKEDNDEGWTEREGFLARFDSTRQGHHCPTARETRIREIDTRQSLADEWRVMCNPFIAVNDWDRNQATLRGWCLFVSRNNGVNPRWIWGLWSARYDSLFSWLAQQLLDTVGRGEGGKQEGVMKCRNRGGKKVKERNEEFSRGGGDSSIEDSDCLNRRRARLGMSGGRKENTGWQPYLWRRYPGQARVKRGLQLIKTKKEIVGSLTGQLRELPGRKILGKEGLEINKGLVTRMEVPGRFDLTGSEGYVLLLVQSRG
jgi:hypothetical protein